MAMIEYVVGMPPSNCLVREQDPKTNRPYSAKSLSVPDATLEEEIMYLRWKMEQEVLDGKPLTSDPVIQLSSLLDAKINQYMKVKKS